MSSVFRSVNLYGLTGGAKLKGEHLSGSGAVSTRLSILSLALLYAIGYRF